jgi:hypothetical protein
MNEHPLSSGQTVPSNPAPEAFTDPLGGPQHGVPSTPIPPPEPTAAIPAPPANFQPSGRPDAALVAQRDSGAGWFFWIAALTLVNSLLIVFGSEMTFGLGLGFTLLVDAVSTDIAQKTPSMAAGARVFEIFFDIAAIGLTLLWGFLGRKGQNWAMLTGLILLALDTLLLIAATGGSGIVGILIHGWAIFSIFAGWKAGKELARLEALRASQANSPWAAAQ